RLAHTMNTMLKRLEDSQARERRFVSDASHELRSPVATIRQHAEVALAHPESSSIESFAQHVLSEDLRLQRLVEDLLLLARTDELKSGPRAAVDLDDVVFEELERLKHITKKEVDGTGVSAGRVEGDRGRLSRLVANLLENAARHASGGVAVSLGEVGDEVVLTVDDDGPGIAPGDRHRVFERFVRLEEARDRDSGGTGLGLAIVAEVTRSHGGSARVLESPRGGARFEVRLPRAV
ncbi:MAG: HAMP domain-containing histidine kinase, partial [Actinomycetota bacterium]|nr:HAMP domain-containing histidine kinase [Actinomycetota bacterium]